MCDWEFYKSVHIFKLYQIDTILIIIPLPIFFFYLFVCAEKVPNRYSSQDLRYVYDILHAPPSRKKQLPILVPICYFFVTILLALLGSSVRQALVFILEKKNGQVLVNF